MGNSRNLDLYWRAKINDGADKLKSEQGNRTDYLNNFDHLSYIFISWRSYGNSMILINMENYKMMHSKNGIVFNFCTPYFMNVILGIQQELHS